MSHDFAQRLLAWYALHGRHDLPWQQDRSPYRVWVSEIMLQQTQVGTVIPYFQRFMEQFPTVVALADAPLDEVLHHWSGLGYYARARNLHKAAREICERHVGEFPRDARALEALPGIGRSTAAAILAQSFGLRHAILDGNVKRVLARYHAVEGWPGRTEVLARLWAYAEQHTPSEDVSHYTQAIMDLGATLCTRSRPLCLHCPVGAHCAARIQGQPTRYPGRKPKKDLPRRATRMLLIREPAEQAVLLLKRPPTGIWGGLWGFPECPPDAEPDQWCSDTFGLAVSLEAQWPAFRHTFSHFSLEITPLLLRCDVLPDRVMEGDGQVWYNPRHPDSRGLAAPVARLLQRLVQG